MLEANTGCKLYGDKGGLKSYHYGEMLKRLNEMDGKLEKIDNDMKFAEAGPLLRKLWRMHEGELTVHTRSLYGGTHEQDIKSKRMKAECFKFEKNEGGYGISIDLVYDTYQKDWSKAYQLAFHGFFTHMDYLSNDKEGEYYSYTHEYLTRSDFDKERHSSEVIIEDVEKLLGDKARLNALHSLPKHDKGPLYDVIGKVLEHNGRSNAEREPFRHGHGCWFDGGKSGLADFSKRLSMDVFAHMASAAVANPKAFCEMKKYLPNACRMFLSILDTIVMGLAKNECQSKDTKNYKIIPQTGLVERDFSIEPQMEGYKINGRKSSELTVKRLLREEKFDNSIVEKGIAKIVQDYIEYKDNFPDYYYDTFGRFLADISISGKDKDAPIYSNIASALTEICKLVNSEKGFNNGLGAPLYHIYENIVRKNDDTGLDKLLHFMYSATLCYIKSPRVAIELGVAKEFWNEIQSWFDKKEKGWDKLDMDANSLGIQFGEELPKK
jgi:hypothetical protein